MALSGYERVKRWREKNTALAKLRRKEYRKRKSEGGHGAAAIQTPVVVPGRTETKRSKLDGLRSLVAQESARPAREIAVASKPVIYRNDYGTVISEGAWKQLQEEKRKAAEDGYVIDEFSQ